MKCGFHGIKRNKNKKRLRNRANNRVMHTSAGEDSPVGGKRRAGGHSDVASRFLMMMSTL